MNSPIQPTSFDRSVKPSDDFFQFVNQKWISENPIPPEESRWGSFYVLRAEVEQQLKKIFEDARRETGCRGRVTREEGA